jgi:cytochrome c-type biogenesis protein CcmF
MIAEIGLALLWLAAGLAAMQAVMGALALARPAQDDLMTGIKPVAVTQAVLVGAAFVCLIFVFLATDLSVKLVATNSHSAKPWIYKFAGTWGNHEGSMLLWVAVLGVAGGAVALFERRVSKPMLSATLMAQAVIALGFYAFLLFSSNPFERQNPVPVDGQGLNPLLQDPGLAFHPPTLYLGYVGMSVAFSFAVGALITRDVGPVFARAMRPWILGAWIFLTLGITAGSYWAYYELGWGGWWFWDPVENASLMPWLAATALLHSVSVLAARDSLRAWTVMLAVVAFSMSMVGTFLVRSGILTSVHAFAVDPERGTFILALLLLYIGGALTLFALRVGTVREGAQFDLVSRETSLVVNNLFLSVILGVVLIGTLYPLIAQAFGQQVSIGPPYYNAVAGAVALCLGVAMAIGPLVRWRRDDGRAVLRRIAAPVALGIVALIVTKLFVPQIGLLPLLGLAVGLLVALASFSPLWKRNLRRTPLFTWGMVIAHLGIGVALIGMSVDSAFMKERLVAMREGNTTSVGPFNLRLLRVEPTIGANWTALEAVVEVKRGETALFLLRPQARHYASPPTETSEAAIVTRLDGQLYTVVGKAQADGRWQMRFWWKPLVTFIWLGGILVALGGFLALVGRVRRDMRGGSAEPAKNKEVEGAKYA